MGSVGPAFLLPLQRFSLSHTLSKQHSCDFFVCLAVPPSLAGAKLALEHRADCVVAMGGAAVIDAGKAIAAIAYADKDSAKAAGRLLAAASEPR